MKQINNSIGAGSMLFIKPRCKRPMCRECCNTITNKTANARYCNECTPIVRSISLKACKSRKKQNARKCYS